MLTHGGEFRAHCASKLRQVFTICANICFNDDARISLFADRYLQESASGAGGDHQQGLSGPDALRGAHSRGVGSRRP